MFSNYLRISYWKRNIKFLSLHFLHYLFVIAFFFFFLHLKNAQTVLDGQNEALPQKSTTYFTISNIYELDLSCLLAASEVENTTLLLHEPSMGLDYEVIYSRGRKDVFGGNFFQNQDFINENVSVLLGCHVNENGEEMDAIKKETGKSEDEIHFLGTLSPSTNAAWNYSIFYTRGQLKKVDTSQVFAITSTQKEYTDSAADYLKSFITEKGGVFQNSNFRQITFEDFQGQSIIYTILFCGLILITLLSETALYSAVLRWRKTLCTLLFFFGSKKIMLRELKRLLRILLTDTFLCGLFIYLFCHGTPTWDSTLFFKSILLFYAISCLAILIQFPFKTKQGCRI